MKCATLDISLPRSPVEHYEMAGYGTARTYAQLLGDSAGAKLLRQTLNEEGVTDKKLTALAQKINVDAK